MAIPDNRPPEKFAQAARTLNHSSPKRTKEEKIALKFDAAGAENCSVLSFGARNIRNEALCQSLGVVATAW
jgi:hypothetical protein